MLRDLTVSCPSSVRPSGEQAQQRNPVIVEPLARSTGHQSWFAGNLVRALADAGQLPTLITFDGMHEDADLAFREKGCDVRRILCTRPLWLRRAFAKVTGVKPGLTAAPSAVRRPVQMYLYNQFATAICVLCACRAIPAGQSATLHLLCPPSWLTLRCLLAARRAGTRVVITAFGAPGQYRGNPALLRRLCRARAITIVVQTETLASDWGGVVGSGAVRMIPLPSEVRQYRGDRRASRRLLNLPDDKPILAVIGCIAPKKGYIELFQALCEYPKSFRVLLVGDTAPWITPEPADVAREAGWLDHTIIRKEFVPEPLMPSLFAAVNAVALLYREPDASSGILSLCQQYRVPVIATRSGEIGAKVRSERLGLTVDPNNTEEVRKALAQLLGVSEGRYPLADLNGEEYNGAICARAETLLSWADVATAYLNLYAKLRS